MNLRKLTLSAAAAALLALPALAASPQKPGEWQITTEFEAADMPMKMKPVVTTKCVTKEDVENPERAVPKGHENSSCKVSDYKVNGNKVTWSMKCESPNGGGPVTGTGEITFAGDTYTGWSKMAMKDHDMTIKWTAKRLGDCK
jgi:hypothetical protein